MKLRRWDDEKDRQGTRDDGRGTKNDGRGMRGEGRKEDLEIEEVKMRSCAVGKMLDRQK